MKLDVGCGQRKRAGFFGIDCCDLPGVDIVHDLKEFPWPVESNSVEEMVLDDVIEHLPDTVATLNEMWRIARPGCLVKITYPYCRSLGAYSDPTHVRFFNEFMIDYFVRPGALRSRENKYAFYTDKYWLLHERKLITYPGLGWLPDRLLRFISRHFFDVVHGVMIVISPDK